MTLANRHIARIAGGDTRAALGAVELAVLTTPADAQGSIHITLAVAEESIQKPMIRCDESLYYDMLSAFCKSLRGSDSDAALAWFARLIYAGVDPKLIARRIIAHASEDVGLANPIAMLQAEAAARAVEFVGMPEARLPLAQAIIAICESPKSNSVGDSPETASNASFASLPDFLILPNCRLMPHVRWEIVLFPLQFHGHIILADVVSGIVVRILVAVAAANSVVPGVERVAQVDGHSAVTALFRVRHRRIDRGAHAVALELRHHHQ